MVCIFNPSTGQWKHLANIPAARYCVVAVGVAGNILLIGGMTKDGEFTNTVWIGVFE